MMTREDKVKELIERNVRDFEHKAVSLYYRGYKDAKKEVEYASKREGMEYAWELIKHVLDMGVKDFSLYFGFAECLEDIRQLTIHEIDAVMKEYNSNAIRVGDEVIDANGLEAIVTNADTNFHLFYKANGKTWKAPKSTPLKKTGKHYDRLSWEGDDDEAD